MKLSSSRRSRLRVIALNVLQELEQVYGRPEGPTLTDPVDELVCCILSQHTTDATSFPTFDRLKLALPTWAEVVAAGNDRLIEIIRRAGLPNQKAKSILGSLQEIYDRNGAYSLENLRVLDLVEARKWLTTLPGVGPKTASIVLCFSLGMPAIPVDTHVFRVSRRIGLVGPKTNADAAHDELLQIVPPADAFRFHVALIQHGRRICKAPLPKCEECVVTNLCNYYKKGGPMQTSQRQSERRIPQNQKGTATPK